MKKYALNHYSKTTYPEGNSESNCIVGYYETQQDAWKAMYKDLESTTKEFGEGYKTDTAENEITITSKDKKRFDKIYIMTGDEVLKAMDTKLDNINKKINTTVNSMLTFEDVCRQMSDLYNRKNSDYDNAFDKSLDKWGLVASATRLGDKMNRIESLIKKDSHQVEESLNDTLLDLASYSIMTYLWLNK